MSKDDPDHLCFTESFSSHGGRRCRDLCRERRLPAKKNVLFKIFWIHIFCGGLGSNGDLIEHKASSCFGHGGEAFEVSS